MLRLFTASSVLVLLATSAGFCASAGGNESQPVGGEDAHPSAGVRAAPLSDPEVLAYYACILDRQRKNDKTFRELPANQAYQTFCREEELTESSDTLEAFGVGNPNDKRAYIKGVSQWMGQESACSTELEVLRHFHPHLQAQFTEMDEFKE